MKIILTLALLLPAVAWGQTFTESMQAAGAAVEARVAAAEKAAAAATARANEVFAALQVEIDDVAQIKIDAQRLADQRDVLIADIAALRSEISAFAARLALLEKQQQAQPALRLQSVTVAVPVQP